MDDTTAIKDSILHLPQGLQDYVLGNVWSQRVDLIGQTNKLTETQSSALKGEVFLILSGIENYSDFTVNAKNNIGGVSLQLLSVIVDDVEKTIFGVVKNYLLDIEALNKNSSQEIHPDKETILSDIENPTPVKPIITNPAGINPILDGQNNLPEGERKVMISSAAVPSRGPLIGNLKPSPAPIAPSPIIKPAQPTTPPKNFAADPYREPAV